MSMGCLEAFLLLTLQTEREGEREREREREPEKSLIDVPERLLVELVKGIVHDVKPPLRVKKRGLSCNKSI